jgi:hypothetical protein
MKNPHDTTVAVMGYGLGSHQLSLCIEKIEAQGYKTSSLGTVHMADKKLREEVLRASDVFFALVLDVHDARYANDLSFVRSIGNGRPIIFMVEENNQERNIAHEVFCLYTKKSCARFATCIDVAHAPDVVVHELQEMRWMAMSAPSSAVLRD